jgi:hypothetical protein
LTAEVAETILKRIHMRPRRRGADSGSQVRAVPTRSRVTVRRGSSLPRQATLAAALRDSRQALGALQDELDALLSALRSSPAGVDAAAADRLHDAVQLAGLAFAGLRR